MAKLGYVYILANKPKGTLYVGVTSDLIKRIFQHRNAEIDGFTARYGIKTLVYYENHEDIAVAIAREKRVKKWRRSWKIDLIEENNPEWRDLWPSIVGEAP